MKTSLKMSRRWWLGTALTAPVAATAGAGLSYWWLRRGARALRTPTSRTASERRILDVIAEYDRTQRAGSLSVAFEDGRLLRILAESMGAARIVEIGTSFGYSGLWLALALQGTKGRLTTFEIDGERQARARSNFERAGVLASVDLVLGDAHELVTRVEGPIDMVFSDADKGGYLDYMQKLVPVLRPGGLFVTHNVEMATSEYLHAISTDAALESMLIHMSGDGMAVTLKKRS